MPKKTRQEKILSQLRRMREQSETKTLESETSASAGPSRVPSQSYELKSLGTPVKNISTAVETEVEDYSYVSHDLKKTVLFALGAVVFEVILSLTASGGYAKLFFRLF